jgi:hypothetical protein
MNWLEALWMASGENYALYLINLFAAAFIVLLPVGWITYGLAVLQNRLGDETGMEPVLVLVRASRCDEPGGEDDC